MIVDATAETRFWNPRARFEYQVRPPFHGTALPWQVDPGEVGGADSSYSLQVLFPAAVQVPHNSVLKASEDAGYDTAKTAMDAAGGTDSGLPSITWELEATGVKVRPVWGGETLRSTGIAAVAETFAAGDSSQVDLVAKFEPTEGSPPNPNLGLEGLAAQFWISHRPQPKKILASGSHGGTSSASTPGYIYAGIGIGRIVLIDSEETLVDTVVWRVKSAENGEYLVEKSAPLSSPSASPSGWTEKGRIRVTQATRPESLSYNQGGAEAPLSVRFWVVSGRLQVTIGSVSEVFEEDRVFVDTTTADVVPIDVIWRLYVGGERFSGLSFWAEMVRFRRSFSWDSPEQVVGFGLPEASSLEWELRTAPGTAPWRFSTDPADTSKWTFSVTDVESGTRLAYKAQFEKPVVSGDGGTYKGQAWVKRPLLVRAVVTKAPGVSSRVPAAHQTPLPAEVKVRHEFNPQTLEIRSSAVATYTANRPGRLPSGETGFFGDWTVATGQLATEVWLARTTSGGYATQRVFSGYGNTDTEISGAAGGVSASILCRDRSIQLSTPRFDLPWMDGWNAFFAVCFLARLGGVHSSDIGFFDLVPLDPTGPESDLGDGLGGPAYYLPMGAQASFLTRSSNANLWEVMQKIAISIGYMLFFDVGGVLQFKKFTVPAGVKRTFYESDREAGGPEGAWSVRLLKSMSEVRSEVIVIGINAFSPRWDPVRTMVSEDTIVDDPTVFNHLGYRHPAVWVDSIFAETGFANRSAANLMSWYRLPGLSIEFETWLQPDIFPLDVIVFDSVRMGVTSARLMVTTVAHQVNKSFASSTIVGRLVPS